MPLHDSNGKRLHGAVRSLDMGRVALATRRAALPTFNEKFKHPRHLRRAKSTITNVVNAGKP